MKWILQQGAKRWIFTVIPTLSAPRAAYLPMEKATSVPAERALSTLEVYKGSKRPDGYSSRGAM
eukprot:1161875-Pelagomonas_calceolata.AAC.13